MSEREKKFVKIPMDQKEYEIMEKLAEEFGYKSVDEFAETVTVQFLAQAYGNKIKTYEAKQLLNDFYKEKAKKTKLTFEEFTRTWKPASL